MMNRPQRFIFFLVVWLTMISFISTQGQDFNKMGINKDYLMLVYPGNNILLSDLFGWGPRNVWDSNNRNSEKMNSVWGKTDFRIGVNHSVTMESADYPIFIIPSNYYYTQSGFMCKREWELEKATHIPFRFRLGSLADCNALEGKH